MNIEGEVFWQQNGLVRGHRRLSCRNHNKLSAEPRTDRVVQVDAPVRFHERSGHDSSLYRYFLFPQVCHSHAFPHKKQKISNKAKKISCILQSSL